MASEAVTDRFMGNESFLFGYESFLPQQSSQALAISKLSRNGERLRIAWLQGRLKL